MAAERTRSTWTDERIDDLAARMDAGFEHVEEELRLLRSDLGGRIDVQGESLGARIGAQGESLGARIDAQGESLASRIDALHRTMLATVVTFVVGFAGLILTQL